VPDQKPEQAAQSMKEHINYTSTLAHELFKRISRPQIGGGSDFDESTGQFWP